MRIESGTTSEHRIRVGIFLLMCLVFALYFAYDGLRGYPSENLKWARQNIQGIPAEKVEAIETNPRVLLAQVAKVTPGMTVDEVKGLLGEPAAVGEATGSLVGGEEYWYVGPAACVQISVLGGKVQRVHPLENITRSESDIYWQKVFAGVLSIVSVWVLIQFWRINTMRTILDDTGLTIKGRHVAWDRMTGVDTDDYQRKGWLDVVYAVSEGKEDSVRLDSYHIDKFDAIVNEICLRKGFVSPIKPKESEETEHAEP